ncbi:rhodanese-like domain-containing protein [Leptothoe sp. PORK10 BA2]|uniref:rhodanese-like domain-containing protein n=1 Tax=Leptothoe sp. PORK10 BA2 TaxID=3110254 RepID=UPI002B20DA9F|nr:rhodanese-like domain-containing protein [Leptothoe sp. PORK10 BA2]MEA5467142.1 rhodanese-like domain-containing protein [Leptothoe sp. PORK10 BA2]
MTQTQTSASQTINALTLKQWLNNPQSVLLIDVREPVEYAIEHISGAISHPLSKFDPSQIHLQPGQRLLLYCQSGKRSARAATQLRAAGFTDVTELQSGLSTWKAEAYPLEKSRNAPISLFRQVQIVAGLLVLFGTILGVTVSPWGFLLSGLVGTGLVFSGGTNTCAMGMLLAQLPYNRNIGQRWS